MTAQITHPHVAETSAQNVKVKLTESAGTEYVVLVRIDTAPETAVNWREVGKVTARDRNAAIEKYATTNGNEAGTFQAVTAKFWKPVKVTPQTVTTLKLEEAK